MRKPFLTQLDGSTLHIILCCSITALILFFKWQYNIYLKFLVLPYANDKVGLETDVKDFQNNLDS